MQVSDNKEKSDKKTMDKFDIIKAVCIALAAMIILPIIINAVNNKENEFEININTLSSEELAGETYTERTAIDDSDIWETEVPENSGMTYTVEIIDSLTESEKYIEFPLDINLANAEELMYIDGVGTVTAEKIISYRNMYGYFSDYNQLLNVDGIGEKKLDNLMNYIYISDEWLETTAATSTVLEVTAPLTQKKSTETVTVSKETSVTTEDIVIINEEFIDDVENEIEDTNTDDEYEFTYEETTTTRYVNFPLDLNTASIEDLMCIEGIGEQTAQNIVNYARQYGFYSVEDLLNVKGIGNSKLASIIPYVYVNSYLLPPKEETFYQESEAMTEIVIQKVNINTCGKNEFMQLPGIDEALADRIIAFRESVGGFLKIEELMLVDGMTNEKLSAIWNYVYI